MLWSMVSATVWWSVWKERNNRVFKNYAEPSIQMYRKAKNMLLFWARRCQNCDNDHKGGVLRDWNAAIGLVQPFGVLFFGC